MAEQGFILDIDTKFLKHLEQADKALSKSVGNANAMTEAFASTTLGAGRLSNTIQTLLGKITQLGGLKIDDSGFARIDTNAMSASDKVNLLIQNMVRYKSEIEALRASGSQTWLSPSELDSPEKLKSAIADIKDVLATDKTLKLVDTQQLSNEAKLYKDALKELQLSDKERAEKAADAVNKTLKRINKAFKQDDASAIKSINAYEKAMSAAEGTIAQRTNKIAKLQQVEKQLAQDEAKYAKELKNVRDAIQSLTKANEEATKSSKELNENQKPLINTADQLKRAFALVFSVSAIRGYVNQMVRVRGEFELQQRALQAILQSKSEADAIWDKTIALAVRSPFQIKELVTYTKQLAAYRVEADKLYDTNKMLADISAGLGVDMSRLILAFGQVKAANYLRGTELRQFSEAGINILGELSKYFSELEGRAISVGEVFEMVSKRLVSFSDVEEVLHRVTSEGGVFYDMQAKQADTVKGMVSNLKDALDIMLNEIGKDSEGSIKSILEATRKLVSNWKELFFSIKAVGMSFIALKSAAAIYSLGIRDAAKSNLWFNSSLKQGIGTTLESIKALKWSEAAVLGVTKAQYLMGKATLFAQGALRGLGTILIAILPIAAITAVVEIVRRMTEAKRLSEELKSNLQGVILDDTSALDRNITAYKDLIERLKTANEGSKERREIIHRLNNEYGQYLDFTVTEATTVDALASSYDNLVSRMKEKASLATYEKGVQEIVKSYGEKLKDAQDDFFDAFKVGLGSAPILNAENSGLIPKKEEVQQLLNLIRQAVNETNDDIESSAKLVNDVISKYYGDGYKLEAGRMNDVTKYVDLMIEQKSKEKELQSQINEYYGKTLKSREANIALQKLENEYALKQKNIKEETNLSDFEVRQKMSELQDEFEENKIKLYFEFGEISEEEKNRQIDSIKNWATATVKSINESIKNDLGGIFSQEDLSKVLFTRDMQESKSISEYLKSISGSWSNQTDIIKEQIRLKSAGVAIDEEALAKAVKMEKLYRSVASLLGIDLDYTEQISEQMRESINLNLPEEFHISLEQAYMGMDKLISTTEDKERALLNTINQINEQKREGLDYDEERLKQLEDEYFWTKRLLDLISPTTNDPIDKTKVSFINSKLQQEYQLSTVDATKDEVTLLKEANDERDKAIAYEAQIKAMKEMGVPITDDALNNAKNEVEQLSLKAKLLGYVEKEKKTGGSRENSIYDERIKVIDDLNKKYKELNKTLSVSESLQGAFDAYIDAFAEAYKDVSWVPSNVKSMSVNEFITKVLNFPDEDSIVAFFDQLAEEPMKAFERIKVELAKGEYVYDIKVRIQTEKDKALADEIEEMFAGYELSLELEKLNVPRDFAKDFFNIDATSLDELKEKVTYAFTGVEFYSERIKDAGKLMEQTFKGNVDLLNRQLIPAQKLAQKGWEDVGDGLATVFSSSYSVTDASGKDVDILVTPILPDGTVMSQKELEDYISTKIEGAQDVLKADDKGIIIHAGVDLDEGLGEYLHSLQEVFYATSSLSESQKEEFKKYLDKISDMEHKAQQERLKTYLQYARDAVGERAKIKLEEMKKLQEIEIAFAMKPFEKEQERAVRETAKASAIEGVQNEARQATKKLEWEEFQKSDTFISIFQDLDMASEALLNHAITKLREFKDSWIDMPHEEMKSIVQNIEKLEMQLASMGNPFKGYIELQKELKGVGSIEEIQLDTIRQEAKIEALDKELSISEQVLSLHQEGKELEADELALSNDRLDLFGVLTKEVKDIVDGQKRSKKEAQDQINVNIANLSKIKASKEELIKQADAIGKARNMANDLYDAFKNLNDTLSDSDGPTAIFAEMGMSMMNSVFNCIMLQKQLKAASEGADTFGKAMNKAMGVIGWIVMGVQVLSSVLGAVFQAHDNKLERQIQRIQSRVEELNKRLETLDELMDKAFSTEAIEAYSLETQKNIEAQIDAYDRMIALEKDKKKTDSAKIKEYREAQNDLRDQYEEMIREAFSTATSGVLDDVLSTSRGFVDAWYEAFKETGNGVGGLKKQFDSLFKDIILQQAALQVMSPYIEMLKDEVAKYIDPEQHDYTLTPEEAMQLKNFSDWWAQSSNEAMSNFANAFGFGSLEQGDLSDLSKGIQGITESTAQVLEALLNSMRFFVADSNTQLRDLKAAFMSSDVTMNPILNELKQHTQLIRSIESMFDSVIGRGGSTHNGAYLRVLM